MPQDENDYLKRFERRTLGPEHFDHLGHLKMAWIHLRYYDRAEATRRVCEGVEELATAFGAPEKYSHTLTEALMRIIAQRMQGEAARDFERFLQLNRDLVEDAQQVVLRHYSRQRLEDPLARLQWVEPDLAPIERTD
jgi:hypothetical protein